jgi:hypothetical protein
MVARCLVLRTGIFLNIVASKIFIGCSFNGFDIPPIEQPGCQAPNCFAACENSHDFKDLSVSYGSPNATKPEDTVQVCPLLSSIVRDDIEFTFMWVKALF